MAEQVHKTTNNTAWDRALSRFGDYFKEKGLQTKDIPAAIVVHEILGLAIALTAWTACYHLQPSKTLGRGIGTALNRTKASTAAQQAYSTAMARATNTVRKMSWLTQRAPGIDAGRLTTSLAESLVFRAAVKPVTFVFKLWASWQIILLTKRLQR